MAGTDQLAAHLDRGWDLLSRRDLDAAVRSAQRAIEMAPEDPEGYYLLGQIEARSGRAEEALRQFKEAYELDDGYVDAFLAAAEIRLVPLGQVPACIELCDEVLSFVEDPRDITDATLLKFDAHVQAGNRKAAAVTLESLPAEELEDAGLHHRMGLAHYELMQIDEAATHFARAISLDPRLSDAHYFLGLCLQEHGDPVGAIEHWLRTRELDEGEPARRGALSLTDFRVLARRTLDALPAELRERLAGASLVVASFPAAELVAEGTDPRIACWFAALPGPPAGEARGVDLPFLAPSGSAAPTPPAPHTAPAPAPEASPAPPRLTAIFVYQANLLRGAEADSDAEETLRSTIAHEASHFFDIDEEEMERLGLLGLHRHD